MTHTDVARDITVEAGEDQIAVFELFWLALAHHQLAKLLRHWICLLPFHCLAILLAGRPLRGADSMKSKVGMKGEQQYEALAYTASGAEHSYTIELLSERQGHC